MATEGFENFQAVVTSLAAVGAGLVAWMGLHTWKTQIVWNADREVARTALKNLRTLEKHLRSARSPAFFGGELNETRNKHEYLSKYELMDAPVKEQAHRDRLARIVAAVEECELTFDECYSLWGDLLEADWNQTKRLLSDYFATVDHHLFVEPIYQRSRDPALYSDENERLKIYNVVFADPQKYDENDFSNRARQAFDRLIATLRTKVGHP